MNEDTVNWEQTFRPFQTILFKIATCLFPDSAGGYMCMHVIAS